MNISIVILLHEIKRREPGLARLCLKLWWLACVGPSGELSLPVRSTHHTPTLSSHQAGLCVTHDPGGYYIYHHLIIIKSHLSFSNWPYFVACSLMATGELAAPLHRPHRGGEGPHLVLTSSQQYLHGRIWGEHNPLPCFLGPEECFVIVKNPCGFVQQNCRPSLSLWRRIRRIPLLNFTQIFTKISFSTF